MPRLRLTRILWTTFGLWIAHKVYKHIAHLARLSSLPGPPLPSYLWGHAVDIRKAVVKTRYNVWRKEYGPVYRIRDHLLEPVLVLGDPKGAAYVLNHTNIYWRPYGDRCILDLLFGRGLVSSEADEHTLRRRRLHPAFTQQSVAQVSPIFFDLVHRLKSEWDDKTALEQAADINVYESFHRLSLNAITMTMFAHNLDSDDDVSNSIISILEEMGSGPTDEGSLSNRIMGLIVNTFPQLLLLPNPIKKCADMLKKELGRIASEVWDTAERNVSIAGKDGMDARVIEVLSQQSKAGDGLTKDEAIGEMIGILFAGSETVANVMGEFLFELAHQPTIQNKLRAELMEFEFRNGGPPAYKDLIMTSKNGLEYFNAVILETLRCKAVLMDISRTPITDDVIPLSKPLPGTGATSLHVQAGQYISIPSRDGLNLDPDIWGEDADEFRPERWLEPGVGEKGVGPNGIVTFGDGAKMCLGRAFALAEFKIVASVLVRNFSFRPAKDNHPIDFYHTGGNTVKPVLRGRESEGFQLPLLVQRV